MAKNKKKCSHWYGISYDYNKNILFHFNTNQTRTVEFKHCPKCGEKL